tara:strand:+ start:313 stop:921 length:609 start_codon:yes stop_codon:yes gene_type:complete
MHNDIQKLAFELNKSLESILKGKVHSISQGIDCIKLEIDQSELKSVITKLKDEPKFRFTQLTDICGVDFPERTPRFEVVYHLLSVKMNYRLRICVKIDDSILLPTISDLYSCAIWYEREVWDMFGIKFDGHPDLRRLLTDYGFVGHPLRKDFPLTGRVEMFYSVEEKRVIYKPIDLNQDFRDFDFESPWDLPNYNNSESNES